MPSPRPPIDTPRTSFPSSIIPSYISRFPATCGASCGDPQVSLIDELVRAAASAAVGGGQQVSCGPRGLIAERGLARVEQNDDLATGVTAVEHAGEVAGR